MLWWWTVYALSLAQHCQSNQAREQQCSAQNCSKFVACCLHGTAPHQHRIAALLLRALRLHSQSLLRNPPCVEYTKERLLKSLIANETLFSSHPPSTNAKCKRNPFSKGFPVHFPQTCTMKNQFKVETTVSGDNAPHSATIQTSVLQRPTICAKGTP